MHLEGDRPKYFYPDGLRNEEKAIVVDKAKKVCNRCQIKIDCLVWAIAINDSYGIWGGLEPAERKILKNSTVQTTAKLFFINEPCYIMHF